MERRKLWRSSGELLGRFSVGERFHRLLLRPYLLIVGPSWICLLPRLESVRSQDGFTAGTSVHRGKGGVSSTLDMVEGFARQQRGYCGAGGGLLGERQDAHLFPSWLCFCFEMRRVKPSRVECLSLGSECMNMINIGGKD